METKRKRRRPARVLAVGLARALVTSAALVSPAALAAPDYPNRAIQLIVPYGTGPSDSMARIIAGCAATRLGQPMVVLNRPGANAQLGANLVKNAAPDGYTILLAASATVTDLVTTKSPTFDVRTDLEPITKAVFGIQGIYVTANLPAKTIPEFVAYAKANEGKLNYGTAGVGSVNHVSTEAISLVTGISMVHVPYAQGTGALLAGLMAGDIQFATTDVAGAQSSVDTGKVRIIGVIAKERMPSRPDTPTIVEFYPDMAQYTGTLWFGFFAPAKTPGEIVQKLHGDLTACLKDASVRTALKKYGYEDNQIVANTPEQFKASIADDVVRLRDIVERAKIPLR